MPDHLQSALDELAPTGRLRAAVAVGEAASAVWNTRDAVTGELKGVAADLARGIAKTLGLPLEFVAHKSSAAIVEGAERGIWDVGFTPVDAERKKRVDFSTDYFLGDSTYMVRPGSAIATLADVDSAAVRIVGIEGTATLRAARTSLRNTTAQGLAQLDEALAMFGRGEIDALALGRESILSLLPRFPGARALKEHFLATGTAVALPKGRPEALALVTAVVEAIKADGTLRAILDHNGLAGAAVPPPGSRA
ncbi:MAG: glnH [Xanthobacteraceae bacterium]|jgi:polar amino acid transport system substrate-binding protein|nr:glnH [Xanthobacteraceae bacterium]